MRYLPVILGLWLSACGKAPALSDSEARALADAEQRWASRAFADYEMVTSRVCQCPAANLGPVRIVVVGDRIGEVRDLATDSLVPAGGLPWYTVDDLFASIHESVGNPGVRDIMADFDPALGYPLRLALRFEPTLGLLDPAITVSALTPR